MRGVIGKGGMGDKTLAACKEFGCVYLHAVGGAAQVLAECIKKVRNVYLMEKFGAPEAIWEFEVEDFPAVVTMDAHGNSLHKEVFAKSQAELAKRICTQFSTRFSGCTELTGGTPLELAPSGRATLHQS